MLPSQRINNELKVYKRIELIDFQQKVLMNYIELNNS